MKQPNCFVSDQKHTRLHRLMLSLEKHGISSKKEKKILTQNKMVSEMKILE